MIFQSKGKIFLSSNREITQEGNEYRSYHTFHGSSLYPQHKEDMGSLLFLNDDTLNTNAHTNIRINPDTSLLLLPLVGGVEYRDGSLGKGSGFVEAGQICLLNPNTKTEVVIANPYSTEVVNYLQIGIHMEAEQIHHDIGEFDLASRPNQLLPLLFSEEGKTQYLPGTIGKFGGRQTGNYGVKNPMAGVLAFVIDGVFEVQDRLLESRDGLVLWEEEKVEFESLSQEAIILFLELVSHQETHSKAQ